MKLLVILFLIQACNVVGPSGSAVSAYFFYPPDPDLPPAYGWNEHSPHNSLSVTATWPLYEVVPINSQSISYYNDNACFNLISGPTVLVNATTVSDSFYGNDGMTYYFQITSIDMDNHSYLSNCSEPMTIDVSPPVAVTSMDWLESSPSSISTVTANWIHSESSDIRYQVVEYFLDVDCTFTTSLMHTLDNFAVSDSVRLASGNTYYFKIMLIDYAENTTESLCSSAMKITY